MLWKKSESEMKYRLHVVMCRCELPKLRLLNFEASPFIDLRVTSTDEDCLVEMISCKVFLIGFDTFSFSFGRVIAGILTHTHTRTIGYITIVDKIYVFN
jgi:hypothetical protein